jgi:hypothetical protein
LSEYRRPQKANRDVTSRQGKISTKLENVRSKGYIVSGRVTSLTSFFAIDKGGGPLFAWCMMTRRRAVSMLMAIWTPSFG